jgi:NADP-dependent 3-hydroxy acid dehydrogenase YdfG
MRVLITGAASGFGLALARRLCALGHDVIATDRDLRALRAALGGELPTSSLRRMDVTDTDDVATVAGEVGDVDVLVNNAGYAVFAAQGEAELSAVGEMFATNVLGVARVTQAWLPGLRARGGTVVQLSSVAGRMVFAESGFYAASKHAVEALSEALFLENRPWGLRVVVVEPGSFDTGFLARAQQASRPRDPSSVHADQHARWDACREAVLEPPQSPALVVEAIVDALVGSRAGAPFVRVPVGADAARILSLREELGEAGWMAMMGTRYGDAPMPDDPVGTPDAPGPKAELARALGHFDVAPRGR